MSGPRSVMVKIKNKVSPEGHEEVYLIKKLRLYIALASLFGVNRVYLLPCGRLPKLLSYICSFTTCSLIVYSNLQSKYSEFSLFLIKTAFLIGYLFFIAIAFSNGKEIKKLFRILKQFDDTLDIGTEPAITGFFKPVFVLTVMVVIVNCILYCLLVNYFNSMKYKGMSYTAIVVVCFAHDFEQVFVFTLVRLVGARLALLRGRLAGARRKSCREINTRQKDLMASSLELPIGLEGSCLEVLETANDDNSDTDFKGTKLDMNSLHKLYQLLHKGSLLVNSIIAAPLLILFITIGINIITMCSLVIRKLLALDDKVPGLTHYVWLRCLKSVVMLILPCYYCSSTAAQVAAIRSFLHHAAAGPVDQQQRRQLRTFFHQTRASVFQYALCGALRIDMTLYLTFLRFCMTYLLIYIQFYKLLII